MSSEKKLKALVYNKNYISNSHMSRQCYIYQNLSPQQVVKEIVKFVMFVTWLRYKNLRGSKWGIKILKT